MPPASLRDIPLRGTPPGAWQSQFPGGTRLGRASFEP